MTIRGTPAENAEKWKRNLSASTQDIQAGIQRVTESPGQKAAAQSGAYLQGVTSSVDKWKRRVAAVSLESWKADALAGVSRVAAGAAQKQGKMASFLAEFQPHLESVQAKLRSMPRGSLETNLARMVENARSNANFKRSGS